MAGILIALSSLHTLPDSTYSMLERIQDLSPFIETEVGCDDNIGALMELAQKVEP